MKKSKLKITNMKCASCALLIDGDLEDVKGVKKAQTKFVQGECEIEFEEEEIKIEKLIEVIKNSGYLASVKAN